METKIQASRHLIYHAAWLKDNNKDVIKDAAIAKLIANRIKPRLSNNLFLKKGKFSVFEELLNFKTIKKY